MHCSFSIKQPEKNRTSFRSDNLSKIRMIESTFYIKWNDVVGGDI